MESARRIMPPALEDMPSMDVGSSWPAAKREPAVNSFAPPAAATGTSTAGKSKLRSCVHALPLPATGDHRVFFSSTHV